jgi:hypothetical protein
MIVDGRCWGLGGTGVGLPELSSTRCDGCGRKMRTRSKEVPVWYPTSGEPDLWAATAYCGSCARSRHESCPIEEAA